MNSLENSFPLKMWNFFSNQKNETIKMQPHKMYKILFINQFIKQEEEKFNDSPKAHVVINLWKFYAACKKKKEKTKHTFTHIHTHKKREKFITHEIWSTKFYKSMKKKSQYSVKCRWSEVGGLLRTHS